MSYNYLAEISKHPISFTDPVLADGTLLNGIDSGLSHKMSRKRSQQMDRMRIDKWLWAARFFKTRSLAVDEINHWRVQSDQQDVKASREVRVGDVITVVQATMPRTVVVKGLSEQRGPAPVAQQLYEETPESLLARAKAIERNRLSPEPALTIAHGRPTKRDRRDLQKSFDIG